MKETARDRFLRAIRENEQRKKLPEGWGRSIVNGKEILSAPGGREVDFKELPGGWSAEEAESVGEEIENSSRDSRGQETDEERQRRRFSKILDTVK